MTGSEEFIEIQPNKFQPFFAGCKVYAVLRGNRTFDKNIRISSPDGRFTEGIVNTYVRTTPSRIPFNVFMAEGCRNFQEFLDRNPHIQWNDEVTLVEFRLAL